MTSRASRGGEVDAIRWELQLRGDRAKDAVVSLALEAHIKAGGDVGLRDAGGAELAGDMGEWAAQQLVRFVDFRDRSADSNITRCPRLRWWTALVLNAEKARPVVVAPPCHGGTHAQVRRYGFPFLAGDPRRFGSGSEGPLP